MPAVLWSSGVPPFLLGLKRVQGVGKEVVPVGKPDRTHKVSGH